MAKKKPGPWSKTTREILSLTSRLTLLLRDASAHSMEDACDRLIEFKDAWLKSGEGDVLPCSGENADVDGTLCDLDVIQFVINALEMKIENV